MKAQVIDIGPYIKLPFEIVLANVSPRAFQVWARIAADASPENPLAQVHQPTLAKALRCSTQTIGRAIAELVGIGLLIEAGKWEHGRCKIYQVVWNKDSKSTAPKPAPKTQMEIPLESYIRVGPGCTATSPQKPPQLPDDPNRESDEEREWIIARIKASNARQREKEEREAKKNASFGGRGRVFTEKFSADSDDGPIYKENYPLLWGFLRIKWRERRRSIAA